MAFMAMSSIDNEELDIADWLSAIHLERYQDNFKQQGYQIVRDILSLDNEVLQQIGVSATGHRKRILSRMRHVSGEAWPPFGSDSMERAESQEFLCRDDKDNGIVNKNILQVTTEGIGNRISLEHLNEKKNQSDSNIRPVPKPRTVFNKITTAVNKEHLVTPSTVPPATLPTCLENHANVGGNFLLQEGFVVRGSSLDSEDCSSCAVHQPVGVELEVGLSKQASAGAGKPFHPIPCLPVRHNKWTSLPGSSNQKNSMQMEADTTHGSPLSPLPSFAGNGEEITNASINPAPQETLTMISNEIYSGLGPRTASVSYTAGTEMLRTKQNLKLPDMIKQESTSSPERLKSPQMRNSASLKPAQMRNTSSPTPGWIRDGVSPRPAPIGNSASPRASRVRSTASMRPVTVGDNAQPTPNQRRNTASPTVNITPITYTAASLRPAPVGDSGSPRLPRKAHTPFPRPPPIGHAASPRLPRLRNSPLHVSDNTKSDGPSVTPSTNVPSSKLVKKNYSISRQELMGNVSLLRQTPIIKNTYLGSAGENKSNSTRPSVLLINEISHRPTPVGNVGSPTTQMGGNNYQQRSTLVRNTASQRPSLLRNASSPHSVPSRTFFIPRLDVTEQEFSLSAGTPENCVSQRPTTIGISPSSTLRKSFMGKSAPTTPPSRIALVRNSLASELDLGRLGLSHHASPETAAVSKVKSTGKVPSTKCIGNAATQKLKDKDTRSITSHRPREVEHCSSERSKLGRYIPLLKQKPVEKMASSMQKCTGSMILQRPKQMGNATELSKYRYVVSPTPNPQSLPRPIGNSNATRPMGNIASPLPKPIKTVAAARVKDMDSFPTRPKQVYNATSARPMPVGNVAPNTLKLTGKASLNSTKPMENLATATQRTVANHILPRLSLMPRKSSPKTALMKNLYSRAGENDYLVCCPKKKNAYSDSVAQMEDANLSRPMQN